ncbi:MAG TPA: MinD/ParA family protein [Nocardioidaceae bacterium]|nr:MinD/ParA family protein [Nocardioidaceae bacterium]
MAAEHAEVRGALAWRLPTGLRMMGEVRGSGLRRPSYLLRRADGQVVQVSELLYLVVAALHRRDTVEQVLDEVSSAYGRRLTPAGLAHLVERRLMPIGLAESVGSSAASRPWAHPLVSPSMRGTLVPTRVVRSLAGLLAPLFWPPIVAAVLVALLTVDLVLLSRGGVLPALDQVLTEPSLTLRLYVLLAVAALFHEAGHAAACRYGGAEPGTVGFGIWLVFPTFYTDVTDAYRLDRAGRVRTDLGGLYFDAMFVVALGAAHLLTGHGLFLLAVLLLHLAMAQQLVPTTRFDGYYVLADVAGVPDLFARVLPVLRSLVPGAPQDPSVAELGPATRRLVVGWVLVVVPALALGLGWLLWQLPAVLRPTAVAVDAQAEQLVAAWTAGRLGGIGSSVISIALLVLPILGIAVLLWRLGTTSPVAGTRLVKPRSATQEAAMTASLPTGELTAAVFNDAEMLPRPDDVPEQGWQRVVYRMSGGNLNPGPGPAEKRRAELARRLRTPIEGSRRVVVMSRKGGVGKTTMTLALGSVFATLRGDRVVAVDANPDAGNLAHRVAPPTKRTVTDVLEDLDEISSYAELRSYLSQAPQSRLEVLASDDDPRIGMALDRDDYHRLIGLLDHYYNLILLDTGTGILDSANQGLLAEADELVLVLRAGVDGGRAAALTLDWLDEHDYGELVRRAVVVINAVRPGVGAPLEPMTEHFSQRCSRVVTVPWDPALETGGQTGLSGLRRETQDGLVEMAAAVADNFPMSGARR